MTDIRLSESGRLVKSDNIEKIEEGLRESKTGNVMTIEETTDYIKKKLCILEIIASAQLSILLIAKNRFYAISE